MNTKTIVSTFATLAILVVPAVSLASTYQYIDTSGNLRSVEAASPSIAIATAPNIALHSGVILGTIYGTGGSYEPVTYEPVTIGGSFYQYIDTSGNLRSIDAPSASIAIATAPNIAQHSGVILVDNTSKLSN